MLGSRYFQDPITFLSKRSECVKEYPLDAPKDAPLVDLVDLRHLQTLQIFSSSACLRLSSATRHLIMNSCSRSVEVRSSLGQKIEISGQLANGFEEDSRNFSVLLLWTIRLACFNYTA